SAFGRFDYDGVAADERRDQFPGRNRHRKIPWRNQAAETDRLAHAHRKLVRHFGWSSKAMQPPSLTGGVVSAIDSFLHIAAGLFQDLAHFTRHVGREAIF